MGSWISLEKELLGRAKFGNFKRMLAIKKDRDAIGILASLWLFVLENAWEDGDLERWGAAGIADACEWDGDPEDFISALRDCGGKSGKDKLPGFLDGWVVHNWTRRSSKLIRDRLWRRGMRAKNDSPGVDPEVIDIWNEFATKHGLQVIEAQEVRAETLMSVPQFEALLKKAEQQPFLLGDQNGGWKATFNWIIHRANAQKVASMFYLRKGKADEAPKDDWHERAQQLIKRRGK